MSGVCGTGVVCCVVRQTVAEVVFTLSVCTEDNIAGYLGFEEDGLNVSAKVGGLSCT